MTDHVECGLGAEGYEMVNPADPLEKIARYEKVNGNQNTASNNSMTLGGIRHADIGTSAGGPMTVTVNTSEHSMNVDW